MKYLWIAAVSLCITACADMPNIYWPSVNEALQANKTTNTYCTRVGDQVFCRTQ